MSAQRRGLRTRIVWTTALVAAVAMAAMIGTVVLVLNAVTRNNVESKLEDRLTLISASVASDSGQLTDTLRVPDDSVDDTTWVYGPVGELVQGPNAGKSVQGVADELSTVTTRTQLTRNERIFLAAPLTVRGDASPLGVVVVSESLEPYESTRTEVLLVLIALGLAVTGGTTAVAAWTVSRTLAPVVSMAAQAEDWSEHDLDARFDGPDVRNEIGDLGRTLNVLLDRVAGALRGEQRLTAELAHELRTPLTGVRGEAELALADAGDPGVRERLERVIGLADQMSTTITTLLALARGEGGPAQGVSVDDLVRGAVAHHDPGDGSGAVNFVVAVPSGLVVAGNLETAVRALAPLIDNAARYAANTVSVIAAAGGRTVRITVSDDGPGIATTVDASRLFEPGNRDTGSPGVGLGLSLARRVARTLGGDVELESPRDPTRFVLRLPVP